MGHQQDLERLALGRSAFQDAYQGEEKPDQVPDHADASWTQVRVGAERYEQRYDDKGRPINPVTEARNQTMRNAQNAVLALVGVVESKENSDRELAKQNSQLLEARAERMQFEHIRGEHLDMTTTFLHVALTWWPSALVSQVQAGLYVGSESFCDVISTQLEAMQNGSMKDLFDLFFAGLPTSFLHRSLKVLLCRVAQGGIGRLQAMLDRRRFNQKASKSVNRALVLAFEALVVSIDFVLLPVQYYAVTQMLGLTPARPLLPNWRTMLPWNTQSVHSFIWKPVVEAPWLGRLCSPAVLILLQNYLRAKYEHTIPPVHSNTSFNYAQFDAPELIIPRLDLPQGPFSKLLNHGYLFRDKLLEWFGWDLAYMGNISQSTLGRTTSEGDSGLPAVHGSPTLTYLPAHYFAERIDDLLGRLLMLPWKSTVLRVITQSFLSSTLPKTPLAITSTPRVYPPFGGGPISLLPSFGLSAVARHEVTNYVNKLGLSLALNCTVEIGLFFIVYRLTRWRGVHDRQLDGLRNMNTGGEGNT